MTGIKLPDGRTLISINDTLDSCWVSQEYHKDWAIRVNDVTGSMQHIEKFATEEEAIARGEELANGGWEKMHPKRMFSQETKDKIKEDTGFKGMCLVHV